MAYKTEKSPLLELLNQRWNTFISGMPDPTLHRPFHRPSVYNDPVWDARAKAAAKAYADADKSDPFVYSRELMHIYQGLALPSEVAKDAAQCARVYVPAPLGELYENTRSR